jgi:hypothetical protein
MERLSGWVVARPFTGAWRSRRPSSAESGNDRQAALTAGFGLLVPVATAPFAEPRVPEAGGTE